MIALGIKSDPIEYRYSYEWLFDLMNEAGINLLQLGSFFELYSLEDGYFEELRNVAEKKGIRIKSVFTAHRELGGFFVDNPFMESVARKNFERLIHVAGILGADYCGSNPGAVYRDHMTNKQNGIDTYLQHMKELSALAKEEGLKGLTMEPMSCLAEPPTTPEEMDYMIGALNDHYRVHPDSSVPAFLCGDISHGLADKDKNIIYSNLELFKHGLPMMAEFHFKNTDAHFNSTFGFSKKERKRGIIDLEQIKAILEEFESQLPVDDFVGYLEIGGPKLGRDFSDLMLRTNLLESLTAIRKVFDKKSIPAT